MSVPFTTAPSHAGATSEPSPGKLPAVLLLLRGLAERPTDTRTFYSDWLTTLCSSTGAIAARCWTTSKPAAWEPLAQAGQFDGLPELPVERLEELRRTRLPILAQSVPSPDGSSQEPSQHQDPAEAYSEIWCPLSVAGEVRGAVVIVFAVASPAARQGCMKFLLEATESIERFHLLNDRRDALLREELKNRELELSTTFHRALDLKAMTATIANDGRLFLGADRVALLVRRGRGFRVAAVSGQTEIARRAGAVRALRALAATCAPLEATIAFPQTEPHWDPAFTSALERYVDEHFVKRFVFVPLITTPKDKPEERSPTPGVWLGALIVENFTDGTPAADEAAKIDMLARTATSALAGARQYQSLFLLPVWRFLGACWQACFAPGKALRTGLIAAILIATCAALFLTTTDFTAYCRGHLQPVERRRVFAPIDGVIRKLLVKHGDHVMPGQPLIELQNTDLEIAAAELQGKRMGAFEQSLATERSLFSGAEQLPPAERARLSGEKERLREEIASYDRQLALFAAKRAELSITSPIEGEITTWNADDLLYGRPVRQGQQLLAVAAVDGKWELELNVPDDRSGRVVEAARASAEPLRVTYSPAIDPSLVREARVIEIQNSADLHGDDGNIVLVRAAIRTEDLPQRRPGAEAAAHVHCGRRSTAYVWSRDVIDFIRSKILFRWF